MSVEIFDLNQQLLTVTPNALKHFQNGLATTGHNAIRISMQESGCTGFKYVIKEVNQSEDGDVTLELDCLLKLHLSKDAVDMLRGTEIDYTREGVNQILKFNNPNVTAECGCGESFSIG